MKESSNNPTANQLGDAISEASVIEAISESTYPLQATVADFLRERFNVREEWVYFDKTKNELDSLAIKADSWLIEPKAAERSRIYPKLDILCGCERSQLPYVFFLSSNKPSMFNFPLVVGLRRSVLTLRTDDSLSTWSLPIPLVLGLDEHKFATQPEYSYSFSECFRKLDTVQLSESTYRERLVPIMNAMHYFEKMESPGRSAAYFDCHLTLGVTVLDAPMIGARASGQTYDLALLPWIRVAVRDPEESADSHQTKAIVAVDFVHKDFLKEYVDEHLIPFAAEFSKLAMKHHKLLISGKGYAKGLEKRGFLNIEERLRL